MDTGVFAPLRITDFRRLWLGQIVSVVGDKIHTIAMAMMVYSITGSMLQMGVMLGVTLLPAALFGLPAGVYVDRWDRRRTMMIADIIRAAIVVSIPFVVGYSIWWAYGLAFVASTVSLFFIPAKRSMIPDLVGTEQLMAANSLDNASEAIAEIVGLGLGAAMVATVGYSWAFTIDGITFLVSAASIAMISLRKPVSAVPDREARLPRRDTPGRSLDLGERRAASALRASTSPVAVFASASDRRVLRARSRAIQRGRAGPRDARRCERGRHAHRRDAGGTHGLRPAGAKFLAGMAMFGFVFSLVALAMSIWTAMLLLAATGIANMFFFIPATTLFQTRSEANVRGRVMAANTTATRIAMVLGIVLAGAVADKLPINTHHRGHRVLGARRCGARMDERGASRGVEGYWPLFA